MTTRFLLLLPPRLSCRGLFRAGHIELNQPPLDSITLDRVRLSPLSTSLLPRLPSEIHKTILTASAPFHLITLRLNRLSLLYLIVSTIEITVPLPLINSFLIKSRPHSAKRYHLYATLIFRSIILSTV